jgi:hypothetical protein
MTVPLRGLMAFGHGFHGTLTEDLQAVTLCSFHASSLFFHQQERSPTLPPIKQTMRTMTLIESDDG